ncbi:hypothetical protein IFM5058_10326 [Aspergillus udagawae]|nr:hypothetical protein IFM5058_10326 [Aspergillus udagawae]
MDQIPSSCSCSGDAVTICQMSFSTASESDGSRKSTIVNGNVGTKTVSSLHYMSGVKVTNGSSIGNGDMSSKAFMDFLRNPCALNEDNPGQIRTYKEYLNDRSCAAHATVEVWGTRAQFTDDDGDTALHRFYRHMKKAYWKDQRDLNLPAFFTRELHSHGFVNVAEHVHIVPMNAKFSELETRILANWASGFEARSLELMNRKLGMGFLLILLECAKARRAVLSGVDAFLEM